MPDPGTWLAPLVLAALPAALYLVGVRRIRRNGRRWSSRRTTAFLTGLALVGLALLPPLHSGAADLPRHAVQHVLLGMWAPVALVLGAPVTLALSSLPLAARRPARRLLRSRALHVLSHPVVAAGLSVGGLYLVHLSPLYALSTRSEAVHHLLHAHFLLAGCLFAWAIAGPDPAPRRPGLTLRVAVLVVAGGAHGFLAKLLYSRAPAWPPGGGHSVAEVEQAAQWMYYGGHLADLALLVAVFSVWYRHGGRVLDRQAARGRELEPAA